MAKVRPPQHQALPQASIETWGNRLFAGLFQKTHDRFDAQLEVFQVELFVGGVDVVVGEAEAHHHAGNAQIAVKIADDGDGAAGADEDRLLAPDLAQGGGGSLNVGVIDPDQTGVAGVNQADLNIDAGGGDLLDVVLVKSRLVAPIAMPCESLESWLKPAAVKMLCT